MIVNIMRDDGTVETMTVEEYTRWACLVEAFHFIEEKAATLGVDLSKLIKPLAIDDYIKERYVSLIEDMRTEVRLGLL